MHTNDQKNQYHQEMIMKADKAIKELSALSNQCHFRMKYHFMPEASWINDPNGLIYINGEYHMFYQQHPYSAENGPKHWGHAKSKDLIHWEHLPIALAPTEDYETHGCFSGTSVYHNDKFIIFYTGNVIEDRRVKKQVQCMATSQDGVSFEKDKNNPIIRNFPEEGSQDFRDPKVWRHEDKWYMAIGSGKNGKGNALLYHSEDLRSWKYMGKMAESRDTLHGKIWNCPDFFEIDGKDVFIFSPAVSKSEKGQENRQAIYWVGNMDYQTGKFQEEVDGDVDLGKDFYAPQTLVDDQGRVILIGWLDMWWNAMPTQEKGWAGIMTIPRLVSILDDGSLTFNPVPELQELREHHLEWNELTISGADKHVCLTNGGALEIIADFDLKVSDAKEFGLEVRSSINREEKTVISFRQEQNELSVNRKQSGLSENGETTCELIPHAEDYLKLHLFIDSSSIEVFADDGRTVMSHRIYPDIESTGVQLFVKSGVVKANYIDIWSLKSIW